MNIFVRPLAVAALLLTSLSSSAAMIVNFSGSVIPFTIPTALQPYFSNSDTFSGSYLLDTSVVATGTPSLKTFNGAVSGLQLGFDNGTGGNHGGDGGDVEQYSGSGGTPEFHQIDLGNGIGSVNGDSLGDYVLRNISFDLRGSDLFDVDTELRTDLTLLDFSYTRVDFYFTNGSNVALLATSLDGFSMDSVPAVSAPSPALLMLIAGGLFGWRRVQEQI